MIQSISVTNYRNESLSMSLKSPEESGFFIVDIDGLGPVKANINLTEILSVDGAFYNSARAETRNIIITLGFFESQTETIEDLRQKSYRYFPLKRRLTLTVETDNRTLIAEGYVESNEPDVFSKQEQTIISILCPQAYLRTDSEVITLFTGYTPLFEFPFENPSVSEPLIEFGGVALDSAKTVYYDGDAETGVVVNLSFTGPVTGLTVYQTTAAQIMAFDDTKLIAILGSGFDDGDVLQISTRQGEKGLTLLRAGIEYNILNALADGATWFTINHGDNVFRFLADSGEDYVVFSVEHLPLYEGI